MKLKRSYKQLFYIAIVIFIIKKTFYGSNKKPVKEKYHDKNDKLSLLDQPANLMFNKKELLTKKNDAYIFVLFKNVKKTNQCRQYFYRKFGSPSPCCTTRLRAESWPVHSSPLSSGPNWRGQTWCYNCRTRLPLSRRTTGPSCRRWLITRSQSSTPPLSSRTRMFATSPWSQPSAECSSSLNWLRGKQKLGTGW